MSVHTRSVLLLSCVVATACKQAPVAEVMPTANGSVGTSSSSATALSPCTPPNVVVVPAASPTADTTIVFLHGYGANASDIAPVARALAEGVGTAAIVPDGCDAFEGGGSGRQWNPRGASTQGAPKQIREAAARLDAWLVPELAARALPTKRLVFAGFSQGAMLSLYFATHHAPAAAAVVSFSGKLIEVDDARAPSGLPVLIIHGARDAVIPIVAAADAERILLAKGAKVSRLTRPTMAHAIDDESIASAISFLKESLATSP